MTDPEVQYLFGRIYDAWYEEVLGLGGDPERPTPDEEKLLLLRELQILGPEITYGKETWEAIQELDGSEVNTLVPTGEGGTLTVTDLIKREHIIWRLMHSPPEPVSGDEKSV